jgi:broad specificity phosphatase PhoE
MKVISKLHFLSFLFVVIFLPDAGALDIYILRHAQTLANVTREYTDEHQRSFSPLGLEQVESTSAKLAPHSFAAILVSPAWRTRHTILPYLKERGLVAEIWPELDECCWDRKTEMTISDLPRGPVIEIEDEYLAFFSFRDPGSMRFFDAITPETGEHQVGLAVNMILERFGKTDKAILIVTHYHTGTRLIRALAENAPKRFYLQNATLSIIAPGADGRLQLQVLNDAPVDATHP